MANGFGSLYIGSSGLRNSQNALNTTANNLANVNTTGYVRQQVRFEDKNYTKLKNPSLNVNMQQSGLGVTIADVVHARDIFLDKIYRQESGRKEFYSSRYEVTEYSADLLQELHGEEFKQSVTDLWTAVQEYSTKPEISVYQDLVLEKADLLVTRSQALYSDLKKYQLNINDQIKEDVDRVNEIGNNIYELNLQIQKVEAGGVETAMTLRDVRDNLLDELATYGRIDVRENATGFVFIDFENTPFVDDNRCYNIALKEDDVTDFYTPYWPQLSDEDNGQYVNVFVDGQEISTKRNTDIGSIKAKLLERGDHYGRKSDLDTETDYDKIDESTLMKVQAQVDSLFTSIITEMNDIFCPNIASDTAFTDGTTTYPAGTIILDADNCAMGVDMQLPPRELFVRKGTERYTKVEATDGKTYYVYNKENKTDSSTLYQIGNIKINEELKKQITLMPTYKANGDVDFEMGQKMAAAWEELGMKVSPYDATPCAYEKFYDRIVGELGTIGNVYQGHVDDLNTSVSSYDNQRQQLTGVSSDEELTKLIRYQAAYNASSRFITVISEMTELIVTGLK